MGSMIQVFKSIVADLPPVPIILNVGGRGKMNGLV